MKIRWTFNFFIHITRVVAVWSRRWTCNLKTVRVGGSNPTVDKICCNVHLFSVPRSLTDSVQMKSSMTFIRGNRCIEREKDNFKNVGEVKRFKECTLALTYTHPLPSYAKTRPSHTCIRINCR